MTRVHIAPVHIPSVQSDTGHAKGAEKLTRLLALSEFSGTLLGFDDYVSK